MTYTAQRPIGSGFFPKSTAKDVLEGLDLSGKNIVLTGGYSGIGLEMARALAAAGARVTVPARRLDAAKAALAPIEGDIEIAEMDLANIASVSKFAADYVDTGRSLDILINNAGIMACPETRIGPNWEAQFGVNHLGHMALTLGVRDSLRKSQSARLVQLSSTAHIRGDVNWADPHYHDTPYDKWQAYASAKSANALFALGFDARERTYDIRAFSVHPGGIFTPLQKHLSNEEMVAMGWKNADGTVPDAVQKIFKTPQQGASTAVWAATSGKLKGMGGLYCEDCDIAFLAAEDSQRWEHARDWICDSQKADQLWTMSVDMLKEAGFSVPD